MAEKGFVGRMIDAALNRKEVVSPTEKAYIPSIVNGLGYYPQTSIEQMIKDAYQGGDDPLTDPRLKLRLFQMIAAVYPYAADVIDRKTALVGTPYIESDDERFEDEMNAYFRELRSIGELQNPFAYDNGLGYLCDQLTKRIYTDGSSFLSFLDANGQPIKPNGKIEAIRLHDPERIYYQCRYLDVYELIYSHAGEREVITADRLHNFKALQFERTQSLWGKPLTADAELVLRWWLTAGKSREGYNVRAGAPLEVTMFGFEKPANNEDPSIYNKKLEQLQAAADTIAASYRTAIANKHDKKQGVDLVGTIPASISMETHTYGSGSRETSNFVEEMDLYNRMIASTLKYPIALLGLDNGSDGLGSKKYEVAAENAMRDAEKVREYLSGNVITPILNQKMLTDRTKAPKYKILWSGGNLADQSAKVATEKTQAEAMKILLEAYELVNMNLPPDDSEDIAERIIRQIKG